MIVSATNLSGQFLADPQSYQWLLKQKRTEILDHSLYVFQLPEVTSGRSKFVNHQGHEVSRRFLLAEVSFVILRVLGG